MEAFLGNVYTPSTSQTLPRITISEISHSIGSSACKMAWIASKGAKLLLPICRSNLVLSSNHEGIESTKRIRDLQTKNEELTRQISSLKSKQEGLEITLSLNSIEISILEFMWELNVLNEEIIQDSFEEERLRSKRLVLEALGIKRRRLREALKREWDGLERERMRFRNLVKAADRIYHAVRGQLSTSIEALVYSTRINIVAALSGQRAKVTVAKLQLLLSFLDENEMIKFLLNSNHLFSFEDNMVEFGGKKTDDSEKLEIREAERFSIKCSAHLERISLREAIIRTWKMCSVCYQYYCPECVRAFATCPNPASKSPGHLLDPIGLPIEEISGFLRLSKSKKSSDFRPEIKIIRKMVEIME